MKGERVMHVATAHRPGTEDGQSWCYKGRSGSRDGQLIAQNKDVTDYFYLLDKGG